MKTKKYILKQLLKLQESEATEASDSSSQGKTSLKDRQTGTIWKTNSGHWGAKNTAGNVKYFDAEDPAQRYADGDDETSPQQGGTEKGSSAGGTEKKEPGQPSQQVAPTSQAISVGQESQKKYVKTIGDFTAKQKTLTFTKMSDIKPYSIGGVPFSYNAIPEEFETDFDYNAVRLPNGKKVALRVLIETDDAPIENDPTPLTKQELGYKKYSAGVIIEENDGRIWIVRPDGQFGGYKETFPKGRLESDILDDWESEDSDDYQKNMELRSAAVREAFEETGLVVQLQDYIGETERSTSFTRYYLGKRVGGTPVNFDFETEEVELLHPGEAEKLFKSSGNSADAKVLALYKQYRQANPKEIKIGNTEEEPGKLGELIDISHVYNSRIPEKQTISSQTARVLNGKPKPNSQKGSNAGGIYTGTDGKDRYVKMYTNTEQGMGEHFANVIYNSLGFYAPSSGLLGNEYDRPNGYFSEMIPGVKTLQEVGITKQRARNVMRGFVADILVNNWDAVGTGYDNIVFEPGSDVPIRIDNGGAFLSRAQGAPKVDNKKYTLADLHDVGEMKSFRDPQINYYYASLLQAAEYAPGEEEAQFKAQVQHLVDLYHFHGDWNQFAREVFKGYTTIDSAVRNRMADMLNARTRKLAEQAGISMSNFDDLYDLPDIMHVNSMYSFGDNLATRYELKKGLQSTSEISVNSNAHAHANLVMLDKNAHKSVESWKDSGVWKKPMRERRPIMRNLESFFAQNDPEIKSPSALRGLVFEDDNVAKMFMKSIITGAKIPMVPAGYSLDAGIANSFGSVSGGGKYSVIIKVNSSNGKTLKGIQISEVLDKYGHSQHQGEAEIIMSDRHPFMIDKVYKQRVVTQSSGDKIIYVVIATQMTDQNISENILKEEVKREVSKYEKFLFDLIMANNSTSDIPTTYDLAKLLKK
jgi:8-oxo-dGTP pyrophosphatase MutT (NUDIX family)